MKRILLSMLCGILFSHHAFSQNPISIPLSTLDAFQNVGKNWTTASAIASSLDQSIPKLLKGEGMIVNVPMKGATNLVSKAQFEGDFELDFDFMTSKGSQSAVFLLGRYKILLSDSWPKPQNPQSDIGLVYVQSIERTPSFSTRQPLSNVGKAPGLWQHLKVKFRAPRHDHAGNKTEKAKLEEVYLNGVLIHQELALEGLSSGAMFQDEKAQGPLVFQADEQHVFALKNIHYQPLSIPVSALSDQNNQTSLSPIIVKPDVHPYLLRSYLMFEGNKRTHVISVGNPDQTNYSYDLKQGSILQFWRGDFVDATEMWESRGEPQLARPLGGLIPLTSAPSFAFLNSQEAQWPDSIPFDELHNKGYALDKAKNPIFQYEYAGFSVEDKVMGAENGTSLKREIQVSNAPENLYFRIASATVIESLGKGRYVIGDKSYYIKLDEGMKPFLRKSQNKHELIVAVDEKNSALGYSIIW